jgi:hypothetical protein
MVSATTVRAPIAMLAAARLQPAEGGGGRRPPCPAYANRDVDAVGTWTASPDLTFRLSSQPGAFSADAGDAPF